MAKQFKLNPQTMFLTMQAISNYCLSLDSTKSYVVEIKEERKQRSLNANSYCWILLDKLATHLNIAKEELYKDYIKNIGGNNETVCVQNKSVDKLISGWQHNGLGWVTDTLDSKIDGCTNVILYYGSSTYDSKQMTRLINLIIQDCQQQDIETKTPLQIQEMLASWNNER